MCIRSPGVKGSCADVQNLCLRCAFVCFFSFCLRWAFLFELCLFVWDVLLWLSCVSLFVLCLFVCAFLCSLCFVCVCLLALQNLCTVSFFKPFWFSFGDVFSFSSVRFLFLLVLALLGQSRGVFERLYTRQNWAGLFESRLTLTHRD